MGEKINKVQIDFSKIYNDEYAAASGSGSHSVSEKIKNIGVMKEHN